MNSQQARIASALVDQLEALEREIEWLDVVEPLAELRQICLTIHESEDPVIVNWVRFVNFLKAEVLRITLALKEIGVEPGSE